MPRECEFCHESLENRAYNIDGKFCSESCFDEFMNEMYSWYDSRDFYRQIEEESTR